MILVFNQVNVLSFGPPNNIIGEFILIKLLNFLIDKRINQHCHMTFAISQTESISRPMSNYVNIFVNTIVPRCNND